MKNILILGAYSAIAQSAARCFAKDGARFFLVGRDREKLQVVAKDLSVIGGSVAEVFSADLGDLSTHTAVLEKARNFLGEIDVVLIAYGLLSSQKVCEADFSEAEKVLRVNFLSVVSLLVPLANEFEKKQKGVIAVITSVAGDRGRPSIYTYGSAKGALSHYLGGLRARLAKSNVSVVDIRPGFVDTPMTAAFKKNALFASSETVGRGIYQAVLKKKDVVYLPGFWRVILLAIKLIPEFIFKKLSL